MSDARIIRFWEDEGVHELVDDSSLEPDHHQESDYDIDPYPEAEEPYFSDIPNSPLISEEETEKKTLVDDVQEQCRVRMSRSRRQITETSDDLRLLVVVFI
ncbi:hypothetical protein OROHE_003205 [Orobanche hederae]